jgi:hypothetical protein
LVGLGLLARKPDFGKVRGRGIGLWFWTWTSCASLLGPWVVAHFTLGRCRRSLARSLVSIHVLVARSKLAWSLHGGLYSPSTEPVYGGPMTWSLLCRSVTSRNSLSGLLVCVVWTFLVLGGCSLLISRTSGPLEVRQPPAGCSAGAAERRPPRSKVAGAPPVAGASRAPQGHLLENLGEVAGLQRASGGTKGAKWAKTCPYVRSWAQRDLVKTSRKR